MVCSVERLVRLLNLKHLVQIVQFTQDLLKGFDQLLVTDGDWARDEWFHGVASFACRVEASLDTDIRTINPWICLRQGHGPVSKASIGLDGWLVGGSVAQRTLYADPKPIVTNSYPKPIVTNEYYP